MICEVIMGKDYEHFKKNIYHKLGIDLNLYKEAQMKRRLTSLRNKRGFNNFMTYFQALNKDDDLLKELTDRITINVSEFYRNPKRWHILQTKVLPYLTTEKKTLNIWSAACSTGEEPYSLAIMMKAHFPHIHYQILATDIDETVLRKAQEGIYSEQDLKELPVDLKKKFFTEKYGLYYIDESLKQSITFKQHNLLADRYPNQNDLIVCRNVLIYFTEEAKDMIYRNFNEALIDKGILFVGSTEQIFNPAQYRFSVFDTFFYEKTVKN